MMDLFKEEEAPRLLLHSNVVTPILVQLVDAVRKTEHAEIQLVGNL
jgi:hypothetical protein